MSQILKNLSNFSIFVNVFLFILNIVQNNDVTSIDIDFSLGIFSYSGTINLIVLIVTIGIILIALALVGTNVLGSGLSDTSVSLIIRVVAYVVLWIVISLTTLTFLEPLEITGDMLWGIMTLFYALGLLGSIATSEGV